MNIFTRKNDELTQKLIQTLDAQTRLLESVLIKHTTGKPEKTEEEQRLAAYALNMCMVSISQIIDYNDLIILDQEYDAILNNLNLEHMPKDEALLDVLRQILDTVTFFRIQDGDKKFIDIEYQQKMKNAIWSAVPNIAVFMGTPDPKAIAINLATQVGIGYMNYRRTKAENNLEKDKQVWQLQRTAMEQFNSLRRELFTTAWRLADEYKFPEKYRITENQILQFNSILMDTDIVRRYERMVSIKENFNAYPPFWYYIGNAANRAAKKYASMIDSLDENADTYISGNDLIIQERAAYKTISEKYKTEAKEYFKKYFEINKKRLLRNDEFNSACALEYIELLNIENDKKEITEKLSMISENTESNDVLQLCAVHYLKIGNIVEGIKLLKRLFNEGYNAEINAQLLSMIYSTDTNKYNIDYKQLSQRVDSQILYPFEHDSTSKEIFIEEQKKRLCASYAKVMNGFVEKCEDLFDESKNSYTKLNEYFYKIFSYAEKLPCINFENFAEKIKTIISDKKDDFTNLYNGNSIKLKFEELFSEPFEDAANDIYKSISEMKTMNEITESEIDLMTFCGEIHFINQNNDAYIETTDENLNIIDDLISDDAHKFRKEKDCIKVFEKFKNEHKNLDGCEIYVKGDNRIKKYCKRHGIKCNNIFAIINDKSLKDIDLIFSIDGVCPLAKDSIQHRIFNPAEVIYAIQKYAYKVKSFGLITDEINFISYANIENGEKFGYVKYKNKNFDSNDISNLIKELKDIVGIDRLNNKIENIISNGKNI